MKKILVFTLLIVLVFASTAYTADWSKYESGRDAIRLDGYKGQTGYIEFQDGNNNINGYVWVDSSSRLMICSPSQIDLTTTQLTEDAAIGVCVGSQTKP